MEDNDAISLLSSSWSWEWGGFVWPGHIVDLMNLTEIVPTELSEGYGKRTSNLNILSQPGL